MAISLRKPSDPPPYIEHYRPDEVAECFHVPPKVYNDLWNQILPKLQFVEDIDSYRDQCRKSMKYAWPRLQPESREYLLSDEFKSNFKIKEEA